MKYSALIVVLALALAGCGKQESSTPTAEDAKKAATTTTDTSKQVTDAAKVEAGKMAESAKAAGEKNVAAASNKAQELIDKAKSLVAESKFTDAASVLQQLTGQALSSDQTKLVESLKEQIQKALAAKAAKDAAGDVGGLLKK